MDEQFLNVRNTEVSYTKLPLTITRKVYCGAIAMKLRRGQNGQVYVNCLSGCLSLLTDSVKTPVHVSAMRCLDGTGLIPECKAHCEKTLAELSCCKFIY